MSQVTRRLVLKCRIGPPRTKNRTKPSTPRSGFHVPIRPPHSPNVANHSTLLPRSSMHASNRREELFANTDNALIENPEALCSCGGLDYGQNSTL